MCHQVTHHLLCEHTSTHMKYCAEATTNGRMPCKNFSKQTVPYPPPPGSSTPPCPLKACPFEALGGVWACCWCGYVWNKAGRCGCVMIHEGSLFRCEHICCSTCHPGDPEGP